MADSIRQRKGKPAQPAKGEVQPFEGDESGTEEEATELQKVSTKELVEAEETDRFTTFLDVLRVLTFLLVASCGLSYLISNGESFFWGMSDPPKYLQRQWWSSQVNGPVYLTLEELATFDGTDESKPLYLAINGSIYDVSANRRTYGPGGSYHAFSGCDASRAFVTGCFADDRTGDMRGVEEMFLPIDDPSIDRHWSAAELATLKKNELAEANQRVYEGLKHWVDFFRNSKKYNFVGYIKRPKGWPNKEPKRKLCDAAANGRAKRKIPE